MSNTLDLKTIAETVFAPIGGKDDAAKVGKICVGAVFHAVKQETGGALSLKALVEALERSSQTTNVKIGALASAIIRWERFGDMKEADRIKVRIAARRLQGKSPSESRMKIAEKFRSFFEYLFTFKKEEERSQALGIFEGVFEKVDNASTSEAFSEGLKEIRERLKHAKKLTVHSGFEEGVCSLFNRWRKESFRKGAINEDITQMLETRQKNPDKGAYLGAASHGDDKGKKSSQSAVEEPAPSSGASVTATAQTRSTPPAGKGPAPSSSTTEKEPIITATAQTTTSPVDRGPSYWWNEGEVQEGRSDLGRLEIEAADKLENEEGYKFFHFVDMHTGTLIEEKALWKGITEEQSAARLLAIMKKARFQTGLSTQAQDVCIHACLEWLRLDFDKCSPIDKGYLRKELNQMRKDGLF